MSTITGTRIDQVLHDAVESGAVPNVVAMAADRHGPIYEGAAGPAGGRRAGHGHGRHDVPHRLDDEDGRDHGGAAAGRGGQARSRRAGRELPPGVREAAGARGLRRRRRRSCARRRPRPPCASSPATPPGSRTGSGTRTSRAGSRRRARRTCSPATSAIFTAPLVADPGTTLRVRHQHRLARPRRRGGERHAAGRLLRRAHPRPLGMEHTAFAIGDEQRADLVPIHLRGEDGAWAATEIDWARDARLVGRRPRALLDPARLPALPAHAAQQRHARRRADPRARDRRRGVQQPDRRASTSRRAITTADPGSSADFVAGPGYKFGLGLLLNSDDMPGMPAAGSGAWAGLFNTHFWVDRKTGVTGAIYSQTLPFVEPPSSRSTPTSSRRCTPRCNALTTDCAAGEAGRRTYGSAWRPPEDRTAPLTDVAASDWAQA